MTMMDSGDAVKKGSACQIGCELGIHYDDSAHFRNSELWSAKLDVSTVSDSNFWEDSILVVSSKSICRKYEWEFRCSVLQDVIHLRLVLTRAVLRAICQMLRPTDMFIIVGRF
jgi:hypothetical protein